MVGCLFFVFTLVLRVRTSAAQGAYPSATSSAITAADARLRVGIVADDSMQGRDTGSRGILATRNYIGRELDRMGLRPAGDGGTFFNRVPLERTAYVFSAAATVGSGERTLTQSEIVPLSGASDVPGSPRPVGQGPIVYGGYMADSSVPEGRDLTGAQLDGAVLVLRFGDAPGTGMARQRFSLPSLWAPASKLAAVLIVKETAVDEFWEAGVELLREGAVAPAAQVSEAATGGPPIFLISPALAERLIGQPLSRARQPATGLGTFRYELRQTTTPVDAWNVVAVLPGSDPARAGEYVALGAHYDHVGVGTPVKGDSIYNGADDDGSGTAAILEIAERFAAQPPEQRPARSLLFVWHTGEEKGLLGSAAFTERPTVPRDSIVAQLNIDMIGRNAPDSLYLVGSRRLSTQLGDLIEQVNRGEPRRLRFDYSWDVPRHPEHIYCRSDHYNYARFGIPVTFFTSGLHPQYHQPQDETNTLDYDKLARVASFVGDVAAAVANRPARLTVDKPLPPIGEPCT
jgi:hypothetical protein